MMMRDAEGGGIPIVRSSSVEVVGGNGDVGLR